MALPQHSASTTEEDVLAILDATSQRITWQELIDALKADGRPASGLLYPVERLVRAGRVATTFPEGDPWVSQYGMEPDDQGFRDGPMYVERVR